MLKSMYTHLEEKQVTKDLKDNLKTCGCIKKS